MTQVLHAGPGPASPGKGPAPQAQVAPAAAPSDLPAPVRALLPTADDREFLPAALEILETPPSPVRLGIIKLMAGFVVVALLWAFFGRLDVIAIAQGKVQPPGRVKVVQPTETGKVLRVAKQNGDRVAKDEILVEFDPTDARADREALDASVTTLRAEIARRDAALAAINPQHGPLDTAPAVDWPSGITLPIQQREVAVLTADLSQVAAALASLDAQRVQKSRERDRLKETIEAQDLLVTTQRERVTMRTTLATSGYGTKSSVIDSRESLQKEETALVSYKGQLAEAEAALDVLTRDRTRQIQTFLADYTQKRADAQRQLDENTQRLAKAISRLDNLTLRAPAAGTVQASTLYTVGQVVTTGQEVMRIVPESDVMEVEAYLPNKDIGFVREGQEVSVKVDSFPFSRYGTLAGRVTRVARDAIPQPEATQIENSTARAATDSAFFGGAQRTQNLVFPIIITLERRSLAIDGQQIPVTPGMTVVSEIKTGSRRILEYIFSPVYEVTSESLRER